MMIAVQSYYWQRCCLSQMGQASNQGTRSKYPPNCTGVAKRWMTPAPFLIYQIYDAHLAVVKLDKPHLWLVFNHLGAGSPSE